MTSTAYRNYRASLARGNTLLFQEMRRKEPQTYFRRAVLVQLGRNTHPACSIV